MGIRGPRDWSRALRADLAAVPELTQPCSNVFSKHMEVELNDMSKPLIVKLVNQLPKLIAIEIKHI